MAPASAFESAVFRNGIRPSPALSYALRELLREAQDAWPQLRVDPARFAERVATPLQGQRDPVAVLGKLRGADLYLATGIAGGDRAALQAFMKDILPRALRAAGGVKGAEHLVDELSGALTQKLLVGLDGKAPKILDYSGRGSLASWVCAAAIRTAINLRPPSVNRADAPGLQESIAAEDPELHLVKATYRPAFKAALVEAFAALTPEERTLLRMNLVDGLGIDRLAVMLGAHRSTVARRLARIREGLVDATKRRLKEKLDLSRHELDSLVRAVRSQLSLSVSQLFGP